MLVRAVAAVIPLLVACGSSGPQPPAPIASGTRLRAVWQVAGDARRLVGWHDVRLDRDCGFERYQHGRAHRCLPPVAELLGYYADPACTAPAAVSFLDDPPAYAISAPVDPSATEPELFALGAELDPAAVFQKDGQGGCVAGNPGVPAYPVGAPVPVTDFVGASEQPDDTGQLWLVADDGARAPWAGWDGARAVAPTRTASGGLRWAPWIVAYAGLVDVYSDAACTAPTADYLTDIAYGPIDAVLTFGTDACGATTATFSAAGAPIAAPYHIESGGACVATASPPDLASIAIGAAFADDSWPEVGEVLIGDGPVAVHYATLGDRAIRKAGVNIQFGGHGPPTNDYFVDTASGQSCITVPAADGVTRCLPYGTGAAYYSDAACTQPVLLVPRPTDGCTAPAAVPPLLTVYLDGMMHAWPTAAAITPAQLFATTGTGCAAASIPDGYDLYGVGAELPADRFAEVTREVD